MLESSLLKIGSLLSIGFGAAGSEIIGKNLGSTGEIDCMIAGKRVTGIFGFCDIRQFTDTTECLQQVSISYCICHEYRERMILTMRRCLGRDDVCKSNREDCSRGLSPVSRSTK